MDIMLKIAVIAVLSAVMSVLLRQNEKALALTISILACAVILLLGIGFLQPIWSIIEKLEKLSGLGNRITEPLLKAVGIGVLTQIAGSVCAQAGEASLGKAVEISGSILSVYVALPLLNAVLTLVERLIGGSL